MPLAPTDDGIELYYESCGTGPALVFVHEFAGNLHSWEGQLAHFGRRHKVIAFNARGYPPSSVPEQAEAYSQQRAAADIIAVMDHAGADAAHIVGLSMGGFAALHVGLRYPQRALSLCVAGVGYGAELDRRELFQRESQASAAYLFEHGAAAFAQHYCAGPTRLPFKRSDPRGYERFCAHMASFSAKGLANTQLGVQGQRPSLYALEEELSGLRVPTLIVNGDEDFPCLAPGLMLKSVVPSAALAVLPNCGHTINLEQPHEFNRLLDDFFAQVGSGRWPVREGPARGDTITGMLPAAAQAARKG